MMMKSAPGTIMTTPAASNKMIEEEKVPPKVIKTSALMTPMIVASNK
jgi:hypothetical protein